MFKVIILDYETCFLRGIMEVNFVNEIKALALEMNMTEMSAWQLDTAPGAWFSVHLPQCKPNFVCILLQLNAPDFLSRA